MVATDSTRVSASPGELATLRLNMLPVVFPDEIQKDVVYSLPYSDKLWDETKERARGGKTFHSYRHSDRIYFWPHSGEEMPADLDLSKASTHLASSLASAVVAFAVREAVVDRLMDHMEFERVGRTIEGQVRLFRRRFNLAAVALAEQRLDRAHDPALAADRHSLPDLQRPLAAEMPGRDNLLPRRSS